MKNLRLATINDIDAVEKLYNDITTHLENNFNYSGWENGVYPVRATAQGHLENGLLCVYEAENGEIAGSIALNHLAGLGYDEASWQIPNGSNDVYLMHTLAVSPKYLHKGIGRQLLDYCAKLGKANNMLALRLDASSENAPALALYESCGYVHVDTRDIQYGDEILKDFWLYEKLL
ncbi:MAG: N-acetyltransferase [Oscillospiraceae bacterium]